MDFMSLLAGFGPLILPIGFIALLVLTLIWQARLRNGKIVINNPPLAKRYFALCMALTIIGYAGEFVCVVLFTIASANTQEWLIIFVFGIVGAVGLVRVLKLKNVWAKALIGFLIIYGILIVAWILTLIVAPIVL